MLTQEQIQNNLHTERFAKKIYTFESIDSTNNCAKALANVGADEGVLVFSEHQTAGRGRFSRTWESEKEKNLTFSIILRPMWCEQLSLLTFVIAAGIAKAVEETTGLPVNCQWPNDLYCNGKKFCGILLEISGDAGRIDFVIAGIGINVNQEIFPAELASKAISLRNILTKEIDRVQLLQECIRQLERCYIDVQKNGFNKIMREWNARCVMFGRTVSIEQNGLIITGIAEKVDLDGALVVNAENKTIRILAGDVSIVE